MKVLGIETSCDETAVCLIEAVGGPPAGGESDFRFKILGNALTSQAALHAQYGGVFPNLAKREHAKNLVPLLTEALRRADSLHVRPTRSHIKKNAPIAQILEREPELHAQIIPFFETHEEPNIDAIAITHGPGLEPALWVGINFAKALSLAWNIPLVSVNHMEGHIILPMMTISGYRKSRYRDLRYPDMAGTLTTFEFPTLALLISGGHTELVLSKEFGIYEIIGQTRDDAVGEAFDKVARLLDLSYPGGPEISRLAEEARSRGDAFRDPKASPRGCKLPRPMLHEDNFDFSFSGLKTAVRNFVAANSPLSDEMKMAIAREFEDAATDVLVQKTLRATEEYGAQTVVVGGGVSANTHIRLCLAEALAKAGNIARLLIPPPEFATDNAIMIALAGYFHTIKREFADVDTLCANGNLKLAENA